MMLRRLKDDVEKNLAPKEETIIEVSHCVNISFKKKLLYHFCFKLNEVTQTSCRKLH